MTAIALLLAPEAPAPVDAAWPEPSPHAAPQGPGAVMQHPRLGLNVAFSDDTLLDLAQASGASHDRVNFPMSEIHPAPDEWNWAPFDRLAADEGAHGLQVLGILTQPPIWAAPVNMIPLGLDLPWNDPGNLWAQFVYQTAWRYRDTVHAWQVWNEPDLDKYWPGPPGFTNDRERMRPFARLLKVSYQAIKAANPGAIIVTPGFLYRAPHPQGKPRVIALWQELSADPEGAANGYFFDATAFHMYDGGTCEPPGEYWYDVINDFRANMVPYVGDHPLWITEAGIRQLEVRGFGVLPLSTDRYATLDEAASYVIQNYAYALHKDAGRYYYYRARDDDQLGDVPNRWGLVRMDNTTRPAYQAYQIAARYLPASFAFSTRAWTPSETLGPVSRISLWGTPMGRVSAVWNTGHEPQTYVFASRIPTVTLVRQDGITSTLISASQRFTFTLEHAPNFNMRPEHDICLVASQPLIFIERDVVPPTSTLTLSADLSATHNVTLTWTGQDDLSGAWLYDLQVRSNGLGWTQLLTRTTATRRIFVASPSAAYDFRVRAYDGVGNPQDWSTAALVHLGPVEPPDRVPRAYLPLLQLGE